LDAQRLVGWLLEEPTQQSPVLVRVEVAELFQAN